jgi:hypothetical protein
MYVPRHYDVLREWRIGPRINLDTKWTWRVSFKTRPLYSRYPLDRRMDGPPRPGLDAVSDRRNLVTVPARNWTPVVQPVNIVSIVTDWVDDEGLRPPDMDSICEYTEQAVATADKGWYSSSGTGQGCNNYSQYNRFIMECYTGPWIGSLINLRVP